MILKLVTWRRQSLHNIAGREGHTPRTSVMKYLLYTHKRAKSDILRATEHSRWLSIASLDTAYSIKCTEICCVRNRDAAVSRIFEQSACNCHRLWNEYAYCVVGNLHRRAISIWRFTIENLCYSYWKQSFKSFGSALVWASIITRKKNVNTKHKAMALLTFHFNTFSSYFFVCDLVLFQSRLVSGKHCASYFPTFL